MALSEVLEHIDSEIARLQQARTLLAGSEAEDAPKPARRGRPKGSKNVATSSETTPGAPKAKRKLSPEGRQAIADAMKRRWADRRKEGEAQ